MTSELTSDPTTDSAVPQCFLRSSFCRLSHRILLLPEVKCIDIELKLYRYGKTEALAAWWCLMTMKTLLSFPGYSDL